MHLLKEVEVVVMTFAPFVITKQINIKIKMY